MADKCSKCEKPLGTMSYYEPELDGFICKNCREEHKTEKLNKIKNSIKCAADWKDHSNEDMSEIFWRELSHYAKHPNKKSLSLLRTCYLWACHDNHALANSFLNALKWAKIDLAVELARTDLTEE